MKTLASFSKSARLALVVLAAGPGCAAAPDSSTAPADSAAPRAVEAAPAAVGARLERAARKVDVGEGAKVAKDLAAVRADPAATPDQRDQAALAEARTLEAQGDTAGAIKLLEDLVTAHGNDRSWPLQKGTEGALRRLLTGNDEAPPRPQAHDTDPVAPFAHVLSKYFHEDHGTTHVVIQAFGASGRNSDRIGTFNLARAIREDSERACPLCDTNANIWTSISRSDDWLGILRAGADKAQAVLVYYFSLGDRRIPAHFDAELPMPVAEIEARLEKGEGVVVAKERAGAPPALLVAAPRTAQLVDAEEALAQLTSLPLEPVAVSVNEGLRPDEIEDTVKATRSAQRACYSALLERAPHAEGAITLKLAVEADGTVGEVTSEPSAAVRDPAFVGCMEGVAKKLVFPATGHAGKITFPVRLASKK